ncbi:hypothetical protein [Parasitella parasitica]|uniref:Uncharacterized protein n=1 Tax=Parasitella parasitica TaxID=35722 RepID=A0A0B7N728_9FUNG|nr:hypothetical protein [Parasitella parasitica]
MSNEEDHETPMAGESAEKLKILLHAESKASNLCLDNDSLPDMKTMFAAVIPESAEAIDECYSQGEAYMDHNLKLDQMLEEAKKRERVSTHLLLTPSQVAIGTLYKTQKNELIRLQKVLDDITEENYKLMNEIRKGIREKQEKAARIDSSIDQFAKSIITVNSIPTEDLIDAMNEIDLKENRL